MRYFSVIVYMTHIVLFLEIEMQTSFWVCFWFRPGSLNPTFSGLLSIPNTKWKRSLMVILVVRLLHWHFVQCLLGPFLVLSSHLHYSKFQFSENIKCHHWQLSYLALTVEWLHLLVIPIFKTDKWNIFKRLHCLLV